MGFRNHRSGEGDLKLRDCKQSSIHSLIPQIRGSHYFSIIALDQSCQIELSVIMVMFSGLSNIIAINHM